MHQECRHHHCPRRCSSEHHHCQDHLCLQLNQADRHRPNRCPKSWAGHRHLYQRCLRPNLECCRRQSQGHVSLQCRPHRYLRCQVPRYLLRFPDFLQGLCTGQCSQPPHLQLSLNQPCEQLCIRCHCNLQCLLTHQR